MASMLVDSFADDFRPEDYTDDYRVELQQLIDAKLEGEEAFPTPEKEEEGEDAEVVDLLAALQRSVERHKGTDSKSGGDSKSGSSRSTSSRSSSSRSSSSKSGGSTTSSSDSDSKSAPAKRTRKPAAQRRPADRRPTPPAS